MVIICVNLVSVILKRMPKICSSLQLCSIVNFSLGVGSGESYVNRYCCRMSISKI